MSEFLSKLAAPVFLGLALFTGSDGTCQAVAPTVVASPSAVTYQTRPGEIRFGPYYNRGQAYKIATGLEVLYGYTTRVEEKNGAYYIYASKKKSD